MPGIFSKISDALTTIRAKTLASERNKHFVLGTPLHSPFPNTIETAVFGTGCFWGAEKGFWRMPGVFSTAVGYTAGDTRNPTYEQVCSGRTGHNECVFVAYDPAIVSYADLLRQFWECHDPTQGMRQGNDRGTQYRSGIYTFNEEQQALAEASKQAYGQLLRRKITTEIIPAGPFYHAEEYHQQYLAKPKARPYCSAEPQGISLEGDTWIPEALREKHALRLPPAYWDKHGPRPGCTIRADNKQVPLSSL